MAIFQSLQKNCFQSRLTVEGETVRTLADLLTFLLDLRSVALLLQIRQVGLGEHARKVTPLVRVEQHSAARLPSHRKLTSDFYRLTC